MNPCIFLEMSRSPYDADVSLNQWMALTAPELVHAHLNLSDESLAALCKDKPVIVQGSRVSPSLRYVYERKYRN